MMHDIKQTPTNTYGSSSADTAQFSSGTSIDGRRAFYTTVSELSELGMDQVPEEFISGEHLIYSSPAALAFNSPGAEGFGVKRAALSIPDSVLLLIAPGCCGRNTSGIAELPQYKNRFFFLNMDESDIVTGRHLKKIPDAVSNVVGEFSLREGHAPSAVMICITCVDALLGTDMDRVCRKAEERVGIPVRPSYMYALTREGRKPPMIHIRQSLYSLLEKMPKNPRSINLLGSFAPYIDDCELYDIFKEMGVKTIRELSRCKSYDEFLMMAEANFNVVLNPEARPAAADMQKALDIPYLELKRLYQMDKLENQYNALKNALGMDFDITVFKADAAAAIEAFKAAALSALKKNALKDISFAVGEFSNADPFELSLSLIKEGFSVTEIFGTVSTDNFIYIKKLAELDPGIQVYSNLEPSMIYYDRAYAPVPDIVIGRDAAYYHPEAIGIEWREDIQPFGYAGVKKLYEQLKSSLSVTDECTASQMSRSVADGRSDSVYGPDDMPCRTTGSVFKAPYSFSANDINSGIISPASYIGKDRHIRGFRRFLPPFAPDASGASSVLYSLGGITVICDAGGCSGNICGFDEPRWLSEKSAIFSAGLRDMDAILGRDDRLIEKLKKAAGAIEPAFAAIIGTPVPAVIATDYHALKRMSENRTGIRTLCIDTNGMELYDKGAEKAYLELFAEFAENIPHPEESSSCSYSECDAPPVDSATDTLSDGTDIPSVTGTASGKAAQGGRIGILGAAPIDTGMKDSTAFFTSALKTDNIVCFGAKGSLTDIKNASTISKNIVVAPSGLKAAKYLEKRFGTPYEIAYPGVFRLLEDTYRRSLSDSLAWKAEGSDKICIDTAYARAENSENTGMSSAHTMAWHSQSSSHEAGLIERFKNKRILIVHQQILAAELAACLLEKGADKVFTASWFMTIDECKTAEKTVRLHDENDLIRLIDDTRPDIFIGDAYMLPLIKNSSVENIDFMDLPHFAVSSRLMENNV